MWRLKGYRRAERHKMAQEAQPAELRERKAASEPTGITWSIQPW
jgi:hypothetical protein